MKINCDAAYCPRSSKAAIATVLQNFLGQFIDGIAKTTVASSSDLNSDPSITRISTSNGGSTIARPICSICYEDLNPIIEGIQSISICGHVFYELWSYKELTAKCNILGRGEARALRKLGKAKEKIKKLKDILTCDHYQVRIQELKTAVEVKDNEVSRALKASKKTILEGDVLNDVDWNSNSSSISEDLAVEKNCFSRSEAALDTRSEVHRPCNKNGVSGSKSAFWTNEDWEHNSSIWLILLTFDSNIFFILVAGEVNLAETPVSKVMTRNPAFVLSDTLAVEALQKTVLGKFRHLPIVESGEVIALLDIAKCLYDAIARMERAAEKGKAIAAAVEGVEKQWGASIAGPNTFIETLRDRMFRPFLSTIIPENSKIATVSPTDTVLMATKKMVEYGMSSVVVAVENKTRGILTSKDILMRVIAQNLPPESTPVEKVMTPNPECATVDTPIVDALHIMHDGKFLHLPVLDKDGVAVAVVDVLHITHAAIATLILLDTRSLIDLVTAILQRVGDEIDRNNLPHILYEDEDHDNVVLASDSDLAIAVDHARLAGWKVLKLHLDHSGTQGHRRGSQSEGVEYAQSDVWASAYSALVVGAALIAGLSMLSYLRRNGN
ncbi:CBS domain-containing protein CBSCBSPB1-like [Camellia sinensis]|uniref:CBS domain-containing protein CBSCBSPB1-like n=1 Tax=Camellia sinensis TaxID=4442 RepID=UPI001035F507|nr:CBS domain-containing protein CBSCBSPB1-like [Camellia sinensis]